MKATRRFVTAVVLVALVVVGLLATILLAQRTLKPRLGLDLQGGLSVVLTAPPGTRPDVLDETVNVLRNRIDSAGVSEPQISREGKENILIEIPGLKDSSALLKLVGQTAELFFRPVTTVLPAAASATQTVSATDDPQQAVILADKSANKFQLGPAVLKGDGIKNATAVVDVNGNWRVDLTFKSDASKTWASFTGQLSCNPTGSPTRQVAIDLDGKVQSAPQMDSTLQCNVGITSGTTSITGNFSETDAKNLALVLNTGALPVKLTQSQVQSVSATLGKQSLRAGLIAGALGLALVMLYVAVYYRTLGFQTWIGLFAFSSLIYALVVLLGRSIGFNLTLAGIAGLIVSVGITTDSYIVFFERVKEEVHAGKTLRSSIDRGFRSARGTLFTADAVTFFAAVTLYLLAVGSVRGFALTLGIATALDVALFLALTYPLAALLARNKFFADSRFMGMRPILEGSGQKGLLRKIYRSEFAINFVGRRKLWLSISGALVALSILAIIPAIRGLRYGIDFRGGSVSTVVVRRPVTVADTKASLQKAGITVEQVQLRSDSASHQQEVRVETPAITTPEARDTMVSALAAATGAPTQTVSVDSVGKTWGAQITSKALRGLIVFLIVVILYMSWRLETKMAISGIVALLHDLAITAGVYAITGLQVTPATVIAVLTILGYSLYDTVVVFDKVDENTRGLAASGRMTYTDTVNLSMNQVLMRSINTSLMTLLPVGSLLFVGSFLLGADTLRELALALFVGIAAGTYSSIFVATPLLSILKEREPRYAALRGARKVAADPAADKVLRPGATATAARAGAVAKAAQGQSKPRPPAKVAPQDAPTAVMDLEEPAPEDAANPDDEVIAGIGIGAAAAGAPGSAKPAAKSAARPGGANQARQQPKRNNRNRKKKGGR
ncbi:MAG: protein translocase subunit SecD [Actinomycetota bacterium]